MSAPFLLDRHGHVAHLKLCRPDRANALGSTFWNHFESALHGLEDGNTRVLIVSADGPHFCAGIDTSLFEHEGFSTQTATDRLRVNELAVRLQTTPSCLERTRFPTIAVIQGSCIGAGLELAACCDLRVASKEARFQIAETNVGIMADLGALQRLPRLLPHGIVSEMAMTGESLGAPRAAELGFVNQLTNDTDHALAEAQRLAEIIASKAPLALQGVKTSLIYARAR